jgi:CRISPR-associated protein (TIGR03984 family)
MSVIDIPISQEWLSRHAYNGAAALLEGYPASGFGFVDETLVTWKLAPTDTVVDWTRFAELRLFGRKGEWHCWNEGGHWRGRFASHWPNKIPRGYILWGNPESEGDWWRCSEMRGATVWVPACLVPGNPGGNSILALDAVLRVEREPGTGLAGVTDFRLCGFSWRQQ